MQDHSGPLSRRDWIALSMGTPALTMHASAAPSHTVDVLRAPDSVTAFLDKDERRLTRSGQRWTAQDIAVETAAAGSELPVRVECESAPLMRIRLRWQAPVPEHWRILNDHWERSYGDLEWRGMLGERVLPWYFLAFDGRHTHGYGVATGCASFAFWQVDTAGISLWLDLRNGGGPVRLGQRILTAAVIHQQHGKDGETSFQAARRFCRSLCRKPLLPAAPVYGANNWYYTYGQDCSASDIERDCGLLANWTAGIANRPFMVIDDGWSPVNGAGPWDRGNPRFPDMAALAAAMKRRSVRPGIWYRPLYTSIQAPPSHQLRPDRPTKHTTLDPTVPEVAALVREDMRRMAGWGYELIKHDYSCYDLLGRWGFAFAATLTDSRWHFHDRTKTTAEIVLDLYRLIHESGGGAVIIACNTFGHLAAGLAELQRTGDDASGREFHRTRRMGVNTLAFRAPQHRAFFDLDADCAPLTAAVPWRLSRQWLDLLARSGTPLFVSADPKSLTNEWESTIQRAFALAAVSRPVAEPLDWMNSPTPSRWRINGKVTTYDWYGDEGGTPFPK